MSTITLFDFTNGATKHCLLEAVYRKEKHGINSILTFNCFVAGLKIRRLFTFRGLISPKRALWVWK